MSATIVDIEEYKKKNIAATVTRTKHQKHAVPMELQIELRIPAPGNENTGNGEDYVEELIGQYRAEVHSEISRLEKMVRRAIRALEVRMTFKVSVMCLVSIIVSTLLIISML